MANKKKIKIKCSNCEGKGKITYSRMIYNEYRDEIVTCNECEGKGFYKAEPVEGYVKAEKVWSDLHDCVVDENYPNALVDYRMKLRKEFEPKCTTSKKI